jgi:hypothetical protein
LLLEGRRAFLSQESNQFAVEQDFREEVKQNGQDAIDGRSLGALVVLMFKLRLPFFVDQAPCAGS